MYQVEAVSKGSRRRPEDSAAVARNWPFDRAPSVAVVSLWCNCGGMQAVVNGRCYHCCLPVREWSNDDAGVCGNYPELGGCQRPKGHTGNCGDVRPADTEFPFEKAAPVTRAGEVLRCSACGADHTVLVPGYGAGVHVCLDVEACRARRDPSYVRFTCV